MRDKEYPNRECLEPSFRNRKINPEKQISFQNNRLVQKYVHLVTHSHSDIRKLQEAFAFAKEY